MGDVGINKAMKAMGRGMARAANQKKGAKVPMKYAGGGLVKAPQDRTNPEQLPVSRSGGFGSGTARGTGAQTKGRRFSGVY